MKVRSLFGLFKAKSSGLDLPFNPEAVLCHDAFKNQKIHFIAGSIPDDIYKSMDKLRPDDMVCAICVTDDPRGGKAYNFSVAPKSYYVDNQRALRHPGLGLGISLDRARKGNQVQLVLNFTLSQTPDGGEIKINERYVHEMMRQKGVMKQCSLSLLMQLANKIKDLTVESRSIHIATYKFITGKTEGFPDGPVPSVNVSNTIDKIIANNAKDAANVKEALQRDYKINFGDSSLNAGQHQHKK